ncbi:MAG: glycosyltransferase family 2 protein, partial [Moorea sp. SIO2B7]|nr:glycosyltransferase family 2 protein [Moorena sp. SIO2B7]
MLVSVCIITYKRPEGLKTLLNGINQLTFNKIDTPNIEVIVIDNDLSGSACQFCEEIKSDFKWLLKYGIESKRGISHARNRAIASASENTNFIAIIDDDEIPEVSWLEQLLWVQQEYKADVVSGPVVRHFEEENVPDWLTKIEIFKSQL